jgi:deoxyhypusine synthase
MLVTPKSFDLAIQLTTDTPENGGLSGATLSEAVSWGKISAKAKYVTVYGDATITFPMVAAATISRLRKGDGKKESRQKDLYGNQ